MDKIDNTFDHPGIVIAKLDEIVDWINAHDACKRNETCPICPPTSDEHRRMVDKPSIEQELEAGLTLNPKGTTYCPIGAKCYSVCTRIYLPELKYEEYKAFHFTCVNGDKVKFHDIPVFRTNDTEIRFCTD